MTRIILLILLLPALSACKTGVSLLRKKPPHEAYGDKLRSAGLEQTSLGRLWFQQADVALSQPRVVSLPYRERGYFGAGDPRAVGIKFKSQRGQKLQISVRRVAGTSALYADLWEADGPPKILEFYDTTQQTMEFTVRKDGQLLLRLQPELLSSISYELSISIGPSLDFPVSGKTTRIGSFWGDARDAGARSHEGIDIFASKRTPAVAAANGRITSVTENKLGGKVVFLRPDDADFTLYYAHLDEQLVESGQRVRLGDTVGLVGNTGNAATTPSHLHFGIYTSGGAVDPFPFVNREIKSAPALDSRSFQAGSNARLSKELVVAPADANERAMSLPSQTVFVVDAINPAGYVIRFPDGLSANLPLALHQPMSGISRKVGKTANVYDRPNTDAAVIKTLSDGTAVQAFGNFGGYSYIKAGSDTGWVLLTDLR